VIDYSRGGLFAKLRAHDTQRLISQVPQSHLLPAITIRAFRRWHRLGFGRKKTDSAFASAGLAGVVIKT
jgi:hypothetical protein